MWRMIFLYSLTICEAVVETLEVVAIVWGERGSEGRPVSLSLDGDWPMLMTVLLPPVLGLLLYGILRVVLVPGGVGGGVENAVCKGVCYIKKEINAVIAT